MCVCVCVEIILTIPIHTCHASIWILLSDHMSVPSNRIQAQMRSSEVQLTCHRSDSPHQVIALRRTAFLMELTDTGRGGGLEEGGWAPEHHLYHVTCSLSTSFYICNLRQI